MKSLRYTLFLLLSLVFVLNLDAQITVFPTTFEVILGELEPEDLALIMSPSELSNQSNDTILVGWQIVAVTPQPEGWFFNVADRNITYPPNLIESVLPIVVLPHATDEPITLEATLWGPGCVDMTLILFEFDHPELVIDTIYYSFSTNNLNCGTSHLENLNVRSIPLYPNPAGDMIHIPSDLIYDRIQITNAMGQVIDIVGSSDDYVNSMDWQPGFYLLTFLQERQVVGVGKVVK